MGAATHLLKSILFPSVLFLTVPFATAQAQWEANTFDSDNGATVTVSVTGKALGWEDGQGHPVMRLSCVATSSGGNLGLGFHFPAEHDFLESSVKFEPVIFKVGGNTINAGSSGSIGSLARSEDTIFHTVLVSEGRALTKAGAELVMDLLVGDTLDVQFARFPERYRVRYDLSGFKQSAKDTMSKCKANGFASHDMLAIWQDPTEVVELEDY